MRHIPETLVDEAERTLAPPSLPSPPFGDIPRSIWMAFLCAWGVLFGLFLLFFATDGPAALAVVTASLFAVMTLGLPAALGWQNRCTDSSCGDVIETRNGPVPVRAAATQILLIPVGVVIGLAALIVLTK
jgi:hypothetical protein